MKITVNAPAVTEDGDLGIVEAEDKRNQPCFKTNRPTIVICARIIVELRPGPKMSFPGTTTVVGSSKISLGIDLPLVYFKATLLVLERLQTLGTHC